MWRSTRAKALESGDEPHENVFAASKFRTYTSPLGDFDIRDVNPGTYKLRQVGVADWNCSYPSDTDAHQQLSAEQRAKLVEWVRAHHHGDKPEKSQRG